MIIYHVTPDCNLPSIRAVGVDTSYSQGSLPVVWGVQKAMIPWACIHCLRRHGGRAEDLAILEIDTGTHPMCRFRGALWYSRFTWHPKQIRSVLSFSEYVQSTTGAKL